MKKNWKVTNLYLNNLNKIEASIVENFGNFTIDRLD